MSDSMFGGDESVYRRATSSSSHIPVPARRSASSAMSVSQLGLPRRVRPAQPAEWQDTDEPTEGHAEIDRTFSSSRTPKMNRTTPASRAPLMNASNRGTRVTSSNYSSKSPAVGVSLPRASIVRRRVSGPKANTSALRPSSNPTARNAPHTSRAGQDLSGNDGDNRMDAIESRITSMQGLFDLERRRTEEVLYRERMERRQQEDKVRQLEEDLLEQRRIAIQTVERTTRSMADEELDDLLRKHEREKRELQDEVDRERMTVASLKAALEQQSTAHLTMDSTNMALKVQIDSLRSVIRQLEEDKAAIYDENESLAEQAERLEGSLRDAETLRRKLHNEIQELRGNIRVFVRVRPPTTSVNGTQSLAMANLRYPNEAESTQIELLTAGESALGTATMRSHAFAFDRIFRPDATQADVFAEVEHLIQSVLDGYNTCIFAYGQTGSGKTYTLEGPRLPDASKLAHASFDDDEGLIPRAVAMLWRTAKQLESKGWQYTFEGQMLEIYNEGINDLLGKADVDKGRHEVRHERGRTIVSDTVTVAIQSPSELYALLAKAKKRRQVAATLMNERSSRSHCVFTLRVVGRNLETMESSDAVLNLVDLAGSERLSNSGSGKDAARLKEAQNINRSLSSLADVITALGGQSKQASAPAAGHSSTPAAAAAHIPYRNSTLTWLLKNSLGGNSKTLMMLALSPMGEHQNESLCSLRFASKVNSTVIGTARRVHAAS